MRTLIRHAALLLALALPGLAAAEDLPTRSNREGAVTVQVTPMELGSEFWRFAVQLDTHSVALDQNMKQAAVLRQTDGSELQPIDWEGDLGGGHHRTGVLVFPAPQDATAAIELELRDIGPVKRRSFTWQRP